MFNVTGSQHCGACRIPKLQVAPSFVQAIFRLIAGVPTKYVQESIPSILAPWVWSFQHLSASFSIFQHLSASFSTSADVSAGSEKWPSPFSSPWFIIVFHGFWMVLVQLWGPHSISLRAGISSVVGSWVWKSRFFPTGLERLQVKVIYSSIGCKLIILHKVKKCKQIQFVISYTIIC